MDLFGSPLDIASDSGAVISACGQYRYSLYRRWDSHSDTWMPTAVWVMLNPSTADATKDDPTIRKCVGFASRWGCGSIVVVNLYAWRATVPKELHKTRDPIGPCNTEALIAAFDLARGHARPVIAAWGSFKGPRIEQRIEVVRELARDYTVPLRAVKLSDSGKPYHPLYVPYESELLEVQ